MKEEDEENYKVKSIFICTLYPALLRWSNQWGWDERDMEKIRNAYKLLAGKLEEKRQLNEN